MISAEVQAEAARWLIELDTSDHIEEIWPDFEEWLNRNSTHQQAFVRVQRAWHYVDSLLKTDKRAKKTRWFEYGVRQLRERADVASGLLALISLALVIAILA